MIFSTFKLNITHMQHADRENLKKLGLKIREIRMSKSKSLNEFVLSRGYLTTATWSRIENGIFDLKLSTLLRVSYMLEIKVEELLKSANLSCNFNDE